MNKSKITSVNTVKGVQFLTFKPLERLGFVRHAFSTKVGGVSENEFTSMNLGFESHKVNNNKDLRANVMENYRRFCAATSINIEHLVLSSQDHGVYVRKVSKGDRGIGIFKQHDIKSVDALVTNEPNVAIVTSHADCTPLLFVDQVRRAIGVAHSGWRGTVGQIAVKTVSRMIREFASNPADIICVVGPTIGGCCYEVDRDVAEKIQQIDTDSVKPVGDNKFMVDLPRVNKTMLIANGLLEKNVFISDVCVKCNSDLLFSHRQTLGKRGTMISVMEICKEELC